jgi:hypothetical protein
MGFSTRNPPVGAKVLEKSWTFFRKGLGESWKSLGKVLEKSWRCLGMQGPYIACLGTPLDLITTKFHVCLSSITLLSLHFPQILLLSLR